MFSDKSNHIVQSIPLNLSKTRQLIGLQEFCVTNTLDDDGRLIDSERIFTPSYAKGVFAYRLLNQASLKSHKLYKRLVNHNNEESGFITVPLSKFRHYRFVSSFLYFMFKDKLKDIRDNSIEAFRLVKKISEYNDTFISS